MTELLLSSFSIYIFCPLPEAQRPCTISAELHTTYWDGWMNTQWRSHDPPIPSFQDEPSITNKPSHDDIWQTCPAWLKMATTWLCIGWPYHLRVGCGLFSIQFLMGGHKEAGQGLGGQRADTTAAEIPDCDQGMCTQIASFIPQSSHENERSDSVLFILAFL